jgi:hypothetical protein
MRLSEEVTSGAQLIPGFNQSLKAPNHASERDNGTSFHKHLGRKHGRGNF